MKTDYKHININVVWERNFLFFFKSGVFIGGSPPRHLSATGIGWSYTRPVIGLSGT